MKNLVLIALSVLVVATTTPSAATTPVILSTSPDAALAGTPGFTLTVSGANFASGVSLRVNGSSRSTTFVSSSQITAVIPFTDIQNAGTLQLTAVNPGAPASSQFAFSVLPNSPAISSLTPSTIPMNSTQLAVDVAGQNFGTTSVVRVNDVSRTTTYVSSTKLRFNLTATDVSKTGTLFVTVMNPNNRESSPVTMTVTAASTVPTITLLSPNSVAAGSKAFTLGIVGTNYVSGSIVKVNGVSRATTFVDSTHLNTTIQATEITKAGTLAISVSNPNAQTSNVVNLTVTSTTAPVIQTLSPSSVTVGSPAFTLTVNGQNFTSGATAKVGANTRTVTFISSSQLTISVLSSDVSTVGQVAVTVTTPGTTGGTSAPATLFVLDKNGPSLSSLNPQSIAAGSASQKVVLTGSNFLIDDVVQVNGTARVTEFISSTQLAVTVTAADLASSGSLSITVVRKDNSASSAPLTLTVSSATAPAIVSFSPSHADTGSGPITLIVTGQNFTSTSVVTFDNTPRATEFVSSTELHVALTAADLASAHDYSVVVVNGDGTSSDALIFSVSTPVPAISSVSPQSVISGDGGFQLTVNGTNFSATSKINVNGTALATQFDATAGTLTANVTADAIASPGSLSVTVSDNGVTSAAAQISVLRPTITSMDPTTVVSGTPSVTLNILGTAFLPTSKVIYKGSELLTTYDPNHNSLSAIINGANLLDPGTFAIVVKNSETSSSVPVFLQVVSAGTPKIDAIDPATLSVGSGVTTIRLTGTSFVPLSVVRINGTDRSTTFVSGTEVRATLLPQDLAAPGTLHVVVRNPDGQVSTEALLTVTGQVVVPPRRRAVSH